MTSAHTSPVKYVFLDVVGFTRDRSVEAQSDIISSLNRVVSTAIDELAIPRDSIILIPTGDGVCIALLGLQDPFDCHLQLALEILKSIESHNSHSEDASRQFQVRIGVNENVDNVVDDINGNRNVAGSGVNTAQRIMAQADGGQILVGEFVYEPLRAREKYMRSFRQCPASGKHGRTFNVYQYVEDQVPGLNTEIPAAFAPEKHAEPKLDKRTAYYLAFAEANSDFLMAKNNETECSHVAVNLLFLLADDAVRESCDNGHVRFYPMSWGWGTACIEEKYEYYKGSDFTINAELSDLIKQVYLSNFSFCFQDGANPSAGRSECDESRASRTSRSCNRLSRHTCLGA